MRSLPLYPALLALAAVGCGGSAATVSRSDVERQTREGLTKSVGQQAPPAKCPEPLKAEVGASTRCTMDFPERKRLGITVKVTELPKDGDSFGLAIRADEALTDIK